MAEKQLEPESRSRKPNRSPESIARRLEYGRRHGAAVRAAAGVIALGTELCCRECGDRFTKGHPRQFCCPACRSTKAKRHRATERRQETLRAWRDANADKLRKINRENAAKLRAKGYHTAYARKRFEKNPHLRLNSRMSALIRAAIGKGKAGKRWTEIVGYSFDELKNHLEAGFLDGMGWHNIGQWHIDHIVPQSWFKFEGYLDPEFQRCWALDNLQPLWAEDNMKKGNRFAGAIA